MYRMCFCMSEVRWCKYRVLRPGAGVETLFDGDSAAEGVDEEILKGVVLPHSAVQHCVLDMHADVTLGSTLDQVGKHPTRRPR